MLFLIVLAFTTIAAAGVLAVRRRYSAREAARIGMALAMAVAGIAHWVNPTPFLQHLPPWLPLREELILVTGVVEVLLGAALLLPPPWRRLAGFGLAGYLVAVFPGNIYVAVAGVNVDGQPGGLYPWLRLPFQVVFIAWALWSTHNPSPSEPRFDVMAPVAPRSGALEKETSTSD
jgi:uncharacterized membrane protein